jgi:hypothetical protein
MRILSQRLEASMSRRARFLTAILCVLVAGAMAATFVFASGDSGAGASKARKASGFTPAKIAGKWTGTWRNTTFGSEGSIRANAQAKPRNKMLLLADFGGNVFGCSDPASAPSILPKKAGANGWDSKGFRLSKQTKALGRLTLTYNFKTKSLTGSGTAPPCRPEISYTITGKLTPFKLTATVQIDLGGGQTATSELSATKQ